MDIGSVIIILLVLSAVAYQIWERRRGRAERSGPHDQSPAPLNGDSLLSHDGHFHHGDCGDHGGGDVGGGDCGGGNGGSH